MSFVSTVQSVVFLSLILLLPPPVAALPMQIVRNRFLPTRRFAAIYLFGVLFCRPDTEVTPSLIRHEQIHQRQMMEMLVVGFYLWYVGEWLVRLCMRGRAYDNISFEREAYANMHNEHYLQQRRPFAWWKYLKGRKP